MFCLFTPGHIFIDGDNLPGRKFIDIILLPPFDTVVLVKGKGELFRNPCLVYPLEYLK